MVKGKKGHFLAIVVLKGDRITSTKRGITKAMKDE